MMKRLVFCLLFLSAQAAAVHARGASQPKYGPPDAPRAVPLAASNEYFRSPRHPAPGFWALIGYYVPQNRSYSCTVATAAMILNAARARRPKTAADKVITQEELLDRLSAQQWRKDQGTSLDRLGRLLSAAFKAYGFQNASVTVVHVEDATARTRRALVEALERAARSDKDFVLANFNQKTFTDDADVGHTAPVGAYDEETNRVLILDPDRKYYEPYWVTVDTLLAGMAAKRKGSNVSRGYIVVAVGA